ncbi:hypothetical protein [Saccharothrix syringae]|uniref:Uncharacterized protein n=1 Tax=Saccharothrix syringae TaxID=103733 RepID=A0A5Q0H2Q2_SACSY|nr:hypothetical protein [Saccharothrix syringae]QFZ20537.1 hypothetical protein EKG83_26805 [Saccharothrix syringae]
MPGPVSAFVPPYRELHVRDVGDLGNALIGGGLRREFEQQVRARLPEPMMKGVTRCWTDWSQVWVVQCGGDTRNNRVVLAGRQPQTTVEITLPYLHHYQVRTPLSDTDRVLTALQAAYPPGTPTRALADALVGVLTAWAHHRREHHTGVPLAQIDRAIAEPLRPLLATWLYGDEITATVDAQWRLR